MGGCRVHKKTTDRKSLLALRALAESRKPEVSVSMGAWSYKSGPGSQTLFRPQPEKAASGGLGTAEHESHNVIGRPGRASRSRSSGTSGAPGGGDTEEKSSNGIVLTSSGDGILTKKEP